MEDETIKNLAERIKAKFNTQKVILFGSFAKGEVKPGSDVDLLVIMDTAISVKEQAVLIRKELDDDFPIDLIVRTPGQIEERKKMGDFFIKGIIEKGTYM